MNSVTRKLAESLRIDLLAKKLGKYNLPVPGPPPDLWSAFLAEGMVSVAEAAFLQRKAALVKTGCIIEVGSYRGRSAIALASRVAKSVPIYAVEPHEEFTGVSGFSFGRSDAAAFYKNMVRSGAVESVRLVSLPSEVVTRGWTIPVGLLWLDGDHSYSGIRRDFTTWLPHLEQGASVLFDDCKLLEVSRFISELTSEGTWESEEQVGKVLAIRRCKVPDEKE